ncbi:MAG: DNA recombination protein RmuC [Patescibacteria group bacterium]|nr:MAG: DNA recombination protein RmuC [Patescibacteria group bacterium]
MEILITTLIVGILLSVVIFILFRQLSRNFESKVTDFYKSAYQQIAEIYEGRFKQDKESIHRDLEDKRKLFQEMINRIESHIQQTDKERISSFSRLQEAITKQIQQVDKLTITAEALSKVLSNNQMRGQFGEQVAENLLKMSGFVKGTDYNVNTAQSSNTSRPDFSIFLPDRTKINVDVKFPYQNLKKAVETNDKEERRRLLKVFEGDVKKKIKEVAGREYINPDDKTVDFVILFIPNESIFSYIYEKMTDIWEEAMKNKVVLAGPFSFTAILRMIKQAYDNFKFQQNIHEIIALIKRFQSEFDKFSTEFEKMETYINRLQNQYNAIKTTRANALTRVVDKIMLSESDDSLKLLDKN